MKAPRHERAKRATKALKQFLSRHMKSEDISLDGAVNEKIWERGMKNPPHHIEVSATKDDDGKVTVILAPQVTVRGKAVKAKPAPKETKKAPKAAPEEKETEVATEASDDAKADPNADKAEKQAREEAKAKAPIATEPADQLAPKAPKPRQNRSPESSQGTKGQ
jgi:large subunit ribosomal protein L31e